MTPIAKVGGLADVTASLTAELRKRGHEVCVVLPRYASIAPGAHPARPVPGVEPASVAVGGRLARADLLVSDPPGPVPVYYVANDAYFGREGIYDDPETRKGYDDNAERFIFFQRAALELLRRVGFRPDVLHCHDHHTALIPAFLETGPKPDPFFDGTGTVLTIHNLGYQGIFPAETMSLAGLPQAAFAPLGPFEFYGKMNFMKAGIVYADLVTTVSPTYAKEICGPEMGCGLEGVLRQKGAGLIGILNGIDPEAWDPRTDPHLPAHFTPENMRGKAACRKELLRRMSLPSRRGAMLVGMVTRLTEQKGLDLIEAAMERLMGLNVQIVLLGTGQARYHTMLTEASARWTAKVTARFGFDEALAHLIEAGSDAFLMPSLYEPCGLNQMYSLRYGTVPIVRATGGLADTVPDVDRDGAAGTGFAFEEYAPEAMLDAVERALAAFRNRDRWARIVRGGMERDHSWAASATAYESAYARAAAAAAHAAV